jgi:hypothetical protein
MENQYRYQPPASPGLPKPDLKTNATTQKFFQRLPYGLGAMGISFLFLIPAIIDLKATRIIAMIADDRSLSAQVPEFASLQQDSCKAFQDRLKSGDEVTHISFADNTEIDAEFSIDNQLTRFQLCQNLQKTTPNIGQETGTSLNRLLDRIHTKIKAKRNEGNSHPVLVLVTLQAAEPGPNLPDLDFNQIQALVNAIVQDRGAIAIIGPTGELQRQLESEISSDRVRIFPSQSIDEYVDWAFKTGRSL